MNRIICCLSLFTVLLFKPEDANAKNSTLDKETAVDRSNIVIILKQIDYNLWKFVPPILYIIGRVGNSLTVAILRR